MFSSHFHTQRVVSVVILRLNSPMDEVKCPLRFKKVIEETVLMVQ